MMVPRVKEVTARKDYPRFGIAKGDKHWYWKIKLAYGGQEFRSKTYPKPSQLTNSPFLGPLGDIQESLSAAEDVDALRVLAEEIRSLGEEQGEKFDNMPEGLQQGDTGQLLEERRDGCESWAEEIEQACEEYDAALEEIDGMEADELGLDDEATADEIESAREDKRDDAWTTLKDVAEASCQF